MLTLTAVVALSFLNWRRFESAVTSSARSREVLEANGSLLATVKDAEAAMRMFVLTGSVRELAVYDDLVKTLASRKRKLAESAVLPHQSGLAEKINQLADERVALLATGIAQRQMKGLEAAAKHIQEGGDRAKMAELQAMSAQLFIDEYDEQARTANIAERRAFDTFLVASVGCAIALIMLWLLQRAVDGAIAQRNKAIAELAGTSQRLEITLSSIGDGVIATDGEGRVTFLNAVAERLTGWRYVEAAGRPAEEVFRIADEATGAPLSNPLATVLGAETNERLPRRAVLLPKQGEPLEIADSGSPIRTDEGRTVGAVLVFRDITEERRHREELEESERRFRALATALPQMIWSSKPDGTVEYTNPAWADYMGTEGWGRILHPEDADTVLPRWREAMAAGQSYEFQARLKRASDGEYRTFLCRTVPLWNASSEVIRWFGSCTDIDDQTKRADELKESNEALRRSNTDLEQFAYAASHDLQEPLRMVALYTQLLAEEYAGKLDAAGLSFIEQALKASRRMETLLQALLSYSTVTSSTPVETRAEANAAVQDAIENLESLIGRTGAVVTCDDLPAVRVPPVRLTQLFQNLISNSIKYRRETVTPEVRISAVRRQGGKWLFSVQDNGIGMEPQYLDQIFGIFKRLHGHDYEGTGIGLAICQRIVENHGGKIWAESELGNGTTFQFTLPED
jgi:PAS domain S-box-containing protein